MIAEMAVNTLQKNSALHPMKIQFKVDRLKLLLRGIDTESSIFILQVNPATLPLDDRELIYRHLLPNESDDTVSVVYDPGRARQPDEVVPVGGRPGADLVEAESPTLDSLLMSLKELQPKVSLAEQTPVYMQALSQQLSTGRQQRKLAG